MAYEKDILQLEYLPLRTDQNSTYDFVSLIAHFKDKKHVYIFDGEPKPSEIIRLVSTIIKENQLTKIVNTPVKLRYLERYFPTERMRKGRKNSGAILSSAYTVFFRRIYDFEIEDYIISENALQKNKSFILETYVKKFENHGYEVKQIPKVPEQNTIIFEVEYYGKASYTPKEEIKIKLELLESHTLDNLTEAIIFQAFKWDEDHMALYDFNKEDFDDPKKCYYSLYEPEDNEFIKEYALSFYEAFLYDSGVRTVSDLEFEIGLLIQKLKDGVDTSDQIAELESKLKEAKEKGLTREKLIAQFTDSELEKFKPNTTATMLKDLKLKKGQEFYLEWDFGDEHEFGIKVLDFGKPKLGTVYPKIIEIKGEIPPQYPDLEESEEE